MALWIKRLLQKHGDPHTHARPVLGTENPFWKYEGWKQWRPTSQHQAPPVHTHKGVHTDTCMHTDACTQIARTYRCVLFFISSSHFVDCGWVWSNLQEKVEKPGAEQGGLCVWKGEISRQWHSREHILLSRTLDWFSAPTPRVSL